MILMLAMLATVAFLYASVGHGGASGYLAVMALLGFAPALMKSSALIMNLAVSLFSFIGFVEIEWTTRKLSVSLALKRSIILFLLFYCHTNTKNDCEFQFRIYLRWFV